MDRNLGATQVATSSDDAASYGDLFQWGRGSDGHQCRTSTNTALNATVDTDTPPHGNFIIVNTGDLDWRSPRNDNLWQGVNGVNNPCPSGYRVPSDLELEAERVSWEQAPINSTNNAAGAFASPLKLPMAGYRFSSIGSLLSVGILGGYWSSTVRSTNARYLFFDGSFFDSLTAARIGTLNRANGFSVRCLKD
jgi:Fibrobacter succinogenes major domain (Fib_succ_major)